MKISAPLVIPNALPVSLQIFSFWVENRKFGAGQLMLLIQLGQR